MRNKRRKNPTYGRLYRLHADKEKFERKISRRKDQKVRNKRRKKPNRSPLLRQARVDEILFFPEDPTGAIRWRQATAAE